MELNERNRELTGQLQLTVAVFEASDIYYEDCLDDNDIEELVDAVGNFNRLCPAPLRTLAFPKHVASLTDFAVGNEDCYTDDTYETFQMLFSGFIILLVGYCNTLTEED